MTGRRGRQVGLRTLRLLRRRIVAAGLVVLAGVAAMGIALKTISFAVGYTASGAMSLAALCWFSILSRMLRHPNVTSFRTTQQGKAKP